MRNLLQSMVRTETGSRITDLGLLVLRVGAGCFMLFGHGLGKFSNYSTRLDTFADPIGLGSATSLTLAVFAEFFCSIALVLGLGTRLAAIPLLITMLVAAGIVHADDPWAKQEFALLYGWIFIALIFAGAGRISVDNMLSKKLSK